MGFDRWCGYDRADGGDREAREGLGLALDHSTQVGGEDFSEARRMRGANWGDLGVMRDLRHDMIT